MVLAVARPNHRVALEDINGARLARRIQDNRNGGFRQEGHDAQIGAVVGRVNNAVRAFVKFGQE